jgi:hypothetical protein
MQSEWTLPCSQLEKSISNCSSKVPLLRLYDYIGSRSPLPCSQEPATLFCPEHVKSRSHAYTMFQPILMSSHLCLSLPTGLFTSVSLPECCMYVSCAPCMLLGPLWFNYCTVAVLFEAYELWASLKVSALCGVAPCSLLSAPEKSQFLPDCTAQHRRRQVSHLHACGWESMKFYP